MYVLTSFIFVEIAPQKVNTRDKVADMGPEAVLRAAC